MKRRLPTCIIVLILLAAAVVAAPAAAQTGDADQMAQVHARAEDAFKKKQAGELAEAYGLFQQANDLLVTLTDAGAPTLVFQMGECKRELGELVHARRHYQDAAEMKLSDNAPPPFVDAQKRARVEVAKLDARIPTIEVIVKGTSGQQTVTVDGTSVSENKRTRVDPGEHAVSGEVDCMDAITRAVTVAEGEHVQVELDLACSGGDTSEAETLVPTVVPWILIGAGGLGIVIGAITGAVTLTRAGDLEDECGDPNLCDPALMPKVEDNRTLGNVSTATFIIGGVLATSGVVLLFLNDSAVSVGIGPAGLRMRASF